MSNEHRPTVGELRKVNARLARQIRKETRKRQKLSELMFFRDDLAQKLYELRNAPIRPATREEILRSVKEST